MRVRYLFGTFALILLVSSNALGQPIRTVPNHPSLTQLFASLPMGFEENQGQADENVLYLSRAAGYSVYLSRGEFLLAFDSQNRTAKPELVRISLVKANQTVDPHGTDLLPGVTNYYIGNDPRKWRSGIRQYRKVRYHEVYPGVDLVFYGSRRQLEFDFDLAPGSEPSRIVLKVDGASFRKSGKNLELVTQSGHVALLKEPELYQGEGNARHKVSGGYALRAANEVAFVVGKYDRRHALVIDPALVYSTFTQIGVPVSGFFSDIPNGIAVDANGATYITGSTQLASGNRPAFVIKLNPAGSALAYETQLGPSAGGTAIVVDASGNAFVTGTTGDPTFPTTTGAFSTAPFTCTFNGKNASRCAEPFATKLDANGAVVYSTFLVQTSVSDTAGPVPFSIAVDAGGALYITGSSIAQNGCTDTCGDLTVGGLTTTVGAFQTTRRNKSEDFVLKLHPDGSALDYSTYLGGGTGETPGGIAVDANGVAYVDGGTSSPDFPTTTGAFQRANPGTSTFFTQLKADGSGLLYSTFFTPNSGQAISSSIAIDSTKAAYLAGSPPFAAKFDAAGNFVYFTPLPNTVNSSNTSISVDGSGNAYIASVSTGGSIAVSKLNSGGSLAYSFLAGSTSGNGSFGGMAPDTNQNIYLTGLAGDSPDPTSSGDSIPGIGTTVGAFQELPTPAPPPPSQLSGIQQQRMFVQKFTQSLGAAVAVPNPRQVTFSTIMQQGQSSRPRTMRLSNFGDADLAISSISIGGANAPDFAILGSNCLSTVAAGANCSFLVTFTPSIAVGTRNATLNFSFGGGLAAQTVPLTGQAGFPIYQESPNPDDFGKVDVVAPGPGNPGYEKNITFTNTGTGPLNSTSYTLTGSSDFSICSFPGAIGCGGLVPLSIPPGQTGGLMVTFSPHTPGTKTAQLVIGTNDSGSPHTVQFTGIAFPAGNGGFSLLPTGGASTSATITAGQAANYSLVAGASGSIANVTVTCSGAPTAASCTTNPNSFSLNGNFQNVMVTVPTTARTSASLQKERPGLWWGSLVFAAIGMVFAFPRRPQLRWIVRATWALILLGTIVSCGGGGGSGRGGGGGGTPAGTYTITVTATANGANNSVPLTLTVQ